MNDYTQRKVFMSNQPLSSSHEPLGKLTVTTRIVNNTFLEEESTAPQTERTYGFKLVNIELLQEHGGAKSSNLPTV